MIALPKTTETISRKRARTRRLDRLALWYGWSSEEVEGIRMQLTEEPGLWGRYWHNLSVACAAGFAQTKENGFMTLRTWCAQTGRPDPTLFDLNN